MLAAVENPVGHVIGCDGRSDRGVACINDWVNEILRCRDGRWRSCNGYQRCW